MSCLPESTCSVYVDGEMPPEEKRVVESHLVQCRHCRGRVVAFEEEAAVLADLFKQRARAFRSQPPARARARGLALGLAPALLVSGVLVGVAGWLLEQRLPTGMSWMNPINLLGAYEMVFDTIFLLRDAAPEVFDVAIAVGVTAGLAAVVTLVGSALLRAISGTTAGILLAVASIAPLVSLVAEPALALELRLEVESVEVLAGQTLDDSLIASAATVEIDGKVLGDVAVFAERVRIRGDVEGNVFAGATEVLVTGRVAGSLHMVCERCILEGEVTRNVYSGGEQITLADSSQVGGDATLFGQGIRIDGRAGRDLYAGGESIDIRGTIDRTVTTHSQRLEVHDSARIGGDLRIHVLEDGQADVEPGAQIGGDVSETRVGIDADDDRSAWLDGSFYLRAFVYIISAFLVGLALHALVPGIFYGHLETSGDFLRCLGFGVVALIVTPLVLLLCAVTIVGIPIALLGGFLYLTLLFVSTVVVAALVGTSLSGFDVETTSGFGAVLLLGLVVVVAAMSLPFVGWILRFLIGLVGMGLLITTVHHMWQTRYGESF